MKLKPIALAVAFSAAMLGQAQAASTDQVTTLPLAGSGTGDLVLAFLGANNQSIVWDLSDGANDLTVADIKSGSPFSITNAAVSAFVKAAGGIGLWQVFGFANEGVQGDALFNPSVATNVGVATTVLGAPLLGIVGTGLDEGMLTVATWLELNNTAGLPDNGTLIADSPAQDYHFASEQNSYHGQIIAGENATGNVGDLLNFYFIQKDPNQPTDPAILGEFQGPGSNYVAPIATLLGQFSFVWDSDSEIASLNFAQPTPVPVPAAAWLFGSALVGLAGVQRRRQRT